MKCPCIKCPDRFIDPETSTRCHSSCERYHAWADERRQVKEAMRRDRDIVHAIDTMHADSVKRVANGQEARRRWRREGKG